MPEQTEFHGRLLESFAPDEVILGEWTDNIAGLMRWLVLFLIAELLLVAFMGMTAWRPHRSIDEIERSARFLAHGRVFAVVLGLTILVLLVLGKSFVDGSRRAFLVLTTRRMVWASGTCCAGKAIYVPRTDVLEVGYYPGAQYFFLLTEYCAFRVSTLDRWSAHEVVRHLSCSWCLPAAYVDVCGRMALVFRRYKGVRVTALCVGSPAAVLDLEGCAPPATFPAD